MLEPANHHDCQRWGKMPKGKFYLGAALEDIYHITERFGDPEMCPMRICEDLVWYNHNGLFASCHCNTGKQCDPVQVFWPQWLQPIQGTLQLLLSHGVTSKYERDFNRSGGIIIGHPFHFPYLWKDDGAPVKAESIVTTREQQPSTDDSDLRSILASTGSQANLESSESASPSLSSKSDWFSKMACKVKQKLGRSNFTS